MKVLVCGGRYFTRGKLLTDTLDKLLDEHGADLTIVHGAARGADTLAERWAKTRQVDYQGFPAKWKTFGKPAGIIRNKYMLDKSKPDLCFAFKGGRGTQNMISLIEGAGIEAQLVGWEEEYNG